MGAKIVLSGEAQNIQRVGEVVTFTIQTGPATRQAPPGLKLYGRSQYSIACTAEQWERAYQDEHKAVIVEGYLEPRRDEETGALYVAVVATVLQSALAHSRQRLRRMEQALDQARKAFKTARDAGTLQQELEAKASALVQANQKLTRFLKRHPDLAREAGD